MKHDLIEFRQASLKLRLQVGLIEELRVAQPRAAGVVLDAEDRAQDDPQRQPLSRRSDSHRRGTATGVLDDVRQRLGDHEVRGGLDGRRPAVVGDVDVDEHGNGWLRDGRMYQLHPLLRDFLRNRAAQDLPDGLSDLLWSFAPGGPRAR